jgi:hypothetical protein
VLSGLTLAAHPMRHWLGAALVAPWVVLGLAVLVVIGALVAPRFRRVREALEAIVRCSQGHLYTTLWMPLGSLKAVRLEGRRYQRCPVGGHWSWVTRVDPAALSPDEIREARSHRDAAVI